MNKKANAEPKTLKVTAPKNDDELDRLIAELGRVVRNIATYRSAWAKQIDPITKRHLAMINPLVERERALTETIVEYAEKNRERLTKEANSKTVSFSSGTIRWYLASAWRTIVPKDLSIRELRRWLLSHGFSLEKTRRLFQHQEPTLKKAEVARYREELIKLGSPLKFVQPEYLQVLPKGLEDLENAPVEDLKHCLTPDDE